MRIELLRLRSENIDKNQRTKWQAVVDGLKEKYNIKLTKRQIYEQLCKIRTRLYYPGLKDPAARKAGWDMFHKYLGDTIR
jgi:hypothetical protein